MTFSALCEIDRSTRAYGERARGNKKKLKIAENKNFLWMSQKHFSNLRATHKAKRIFAKESEKELEVRNDIDVRKRDDFPIQFINFIKEV
jgi:hypothetical protein